MQAILLASAWHYVFGILLFLISIFLIGLILLQRGRGGGLTGALGGAGGQSAFGSKTGDVFTRVTIIAATVWIVLCLAADKMLVTSTGSVFGSGDSGTTVNSTKKERSKGAGGADAEKSSGEATEGASAEAPAEGDAPSSDDKQ